MIGESLGRKEDLSLLTGRARFVDDIARPEMLHMGV
jgi:CO/xanthine dehydrogenase Mo-binding subunit